jgi:hypothetical protein
MAQLAELVRIYEANEIIFCSKDIGSQEIMANMAQIGPSVSYKIVPEESLSIIGSSSKDEPGELYTIDIRYNIAQPSHRRDKRLIDLCICMGLLVTFPVWLIFSGKRRLLLNNWGHRFTWPKNLGWLCTKCPKQHFTNAPLRGFFALGRTQRFERQ